MIRHFTVLLLFSCFYSMAMRPVKITEHSPRKREKQEGTYNFRLDTETSISKKKARIHQTIVLTPEQRKAEEERINAAVQSGVLDFFMTNEDGSCVMQPGVMQPEIKRAKKSNSLVMPPELKDENSSSKSEAATTSSNIGSPQMPKHALLALTASESKNMLGSLISK